RWISGSFTPFSALRTSCSVRPGRDLPNMRSNPAGRSDAEPGVAIFEGLAPGNGLSAGFAVIGGREAEILGQQGFPGLRIGLELVSPAVPFGATNGDGDPVLEQFQDSRWCDAA